jgi:hypothetical protein
MSVSSVNNPLASALRNVGRPLNNGAAGTTPAGVQPGARPTGPAALRPAQPLAAPQQSLPAEAPAGTDPALWSVLTGEERAYFAKAAAMGPLTYSRISAGVNALPGSVPPASAGVARGARLDIRA